MAAKQGRYFRPKSKALLGTPYDSELELSIHTSWPELEFHQLAVPYQILHHYKPDFHKDNLLIEAKGYFQDANELQKYAWVRKALVGDQELVFVFEHPHKPIHFKAKRKDGSKMTHAEWAEKNGFRWFTQETIGELISVQADV